MCSVEDAEAINVKSTGTTKKENKGLQDMVKEKYELIDLYIVLSEHDFFDVVKEEEVYKAHQMFIDYIAYL